VHVRATFAMTARTPTTMFTMTHVLALLIFACAVM